MISAEQLAEFDELEIGTRGQFFLAPCCEICGCSFTKKDYQWWIEWEAGDPGTFPRMHDSCLETQIVKEHKTGVYEDVFPYS
jgi:hypothetical protein